MATLASQIVPMLEAWGIRHVFGIPGVHTSEIYRGFQASSVTHVTPRHEQGAGFMAHGYAKVSGIPAACLVITGPGIANLATAMLQAEADSVPMLVLTTINARDSESTGRLHEMPDQTAFCRAACRHVTRITQPEEFADALSRAFEVFARERPGPVLIEIPLDLLDRPVRSLPHGHAPEKRGPAPDAIDQAVLLLDAAVRPLILAGGGALQADIAGLAEKLSAPVVTTVNARSILAQDHPLHLPCTASLPEVRKQISDADLVIAVGTELGATDYDMYRDQGPLDIGQMIRIDIDSATQPADHGTHHIRADAALTVEALLRDLRAREPRTDVARRVSETRQGILLNLPDAYRKHIERLGAITACFPDVILAGDSTQPVYAGNLAFGPGRDALWFNAATGFGTLGLAVPAAIGARIAAPDRPVIALVGDGGFQYSLSELGTLLDQAIPIIVIVWNNQGYGEIGDDMRTRGIVPLGTDPRPPEFDGIAKAYGLGYARVDHDNLDRFISALSAAKSHTRGSILELVAPMS